MTRNEILRRVYALYPTMGAWARQGSDAAAQVSIIETQLDNYLGPTAQDEILESNHIRNNSDRAFLRSPEALAAMTQVVDAIAHQQPLIDGLFPEEP